MQFEVADWPNLKKADRAKVWRRTYKQAFPESIYGKSETIKAGSGLTFENMQSIINRGGL